jgi:integrase
MMQFQSVFLNATQVESVARELAPFAPYYLLVRFAAYTGLRAGEMAGLRVRDLDLVVGHVSVRQTAQRIGGEWVYGTPKSRRSVRDVPLMHSGLIAELRRYKMQHPNSGNPDALFWPGRHVGSNRLDYSRVIDMGSFRRNYLQTVLTNAELPPMRFHDLRHTAASLWLAAGFKPYEVSRWRGHANVSTTDGIYAHLYPNDYSKHVARFDAFVALH